MNDEIPTKIVRKFIFDILIERSNKEMQECDKLSREDIEKFGIINDFSSELGWESCGTRVLADDIMSGQISLKEAIQEFLSKDEVQIVKNKCLNWINEQNRDER